MKSPERIDLDVKQVDALLQRTKALLPPEDYELIKAMAETIYLLSQSVGQKATSIQRLLRMLFGAATEKIDKVDRKKKIGLFGEKSKKKVMAANPPLTILVPKKSISPMPPSNIEITARPV